MGTIEPEDEPAESGLTRRHLARMVRVPVQADDHLAPALHIQLAEQVVDMQLRCRQADVHPTGDLLVTEARRDQLGGLPFAPGERGAGDSALRAMPRLSVKAIRCSSSAATRPSRVARHHEYPR
jgi:hypothetical protein